MFQLFRNKNSQNQRRSGLQNPDAWMLEALGIRPNETTVTHETALSIPAFWAAVKRRSQTIASLQFQVFQKTEMGSEVFERHPLNWLISMRPHPLYNAFTFISTLITHLDVYGNAFALVVRDARGNAKRFEVLKPTCFKEIRREVLSGEYFYIFDVEEFGERRTLYISPDDIIHLKGVTLSGYLGLDPVKTQNSVFSAGIANNAYQDAFFQSGAHIQFAIEVPGQFSPTAKSTFIDEFKKVFQGLKRAFQRPLFIDQGAKLHQLKMTPQEAGMIESKKSTVEDMSRVEDVPAHLLGAGERMTFASVEIMMNDFIMYSLRNTVKQLENEFNIKAFRFEEIKGGNVFVRMNLDSLLRGDSASRTKKIETEIKWGVITKNEAREMSGYNKIEDGDTFLTPLNMTTVAEDEQPLVTSEN